MNKCECGIERDPNELCEARAILLNYSTEGATEENCKKHTTELLGEVFDALAKERERKEWCLRHAAGVEGKTLWWTLEDLSGSSAPILNKDINAAIDKARGGGG